MELVHFSAYLNIHQQAFESMKALLVADTIMRFPDRNFPFHVFIDASDYQLVVPSISCNICSKSHVQPQKLVRKKLVARLYQMLWCRLYVVVQ